MVHQDFVIDVTSRQTSDGNIKTNTIRKDATYCNKSSQLFVPSSTCILYAQIALTYTHSHEPSTFVLRSLADLQTAINHVSPSKAIVRKYTRRLFKHTQYSTAADIEYESRPK